MNMLSRFVLIPILLIFSFNKAHAAHTANDTTPKKLTAQELADKISHATDYFKELDPHIINIIDRLEHEYQTHNKEDQPLTDAIKKLSAPNRTDEQLTLSVAILNDIRDKTAVFSLKSQNLFFRCCLINQHIGVNMAKFLKAVENNTSNQQTKITQEDIDAAKKAYLPALPLEDQKNNADETVAHWIPKIQINRSSDLAHKIIAATSYEQLKDYLPNIAQYIEEERQTYNEQEKLVTYSLYYLAVSQNEKQQQLFISLRNNLLLHIADWATQAPNALFRACLINKEIGNNMTAFIFLVNALRHKKRANQITDSDIKTASTAYLKDQDNNPAYTIEECPQKFSPFIKQNTNQALPLAVMNHNSELVKILIAHGAPVNYQESQVNNLTPLHCAVNAKNIEIATILLQNGANDQLQDDNGVAPLQQALRMNNGPMARLIYEYRQKRIAAKTLNKQQDPSERLKTIARSSAQAAMITAAAAAVGVGLPCGVAVIFKALGYAKVV